MGKNCTLLKTIRKENKNVKKQSAAAKYGHKIGSNMFLNVQYRKKMQTNLQESFIIRNDG